MKRDMLEWLLQKAKFNTSVDSVLLETIYSNKISENKMLEMVEYLLIKWGANIEACGELDLWCYSICNCAVPGGGY